jgi:hypothetical protein
LAESWFALPRVSLNLDLAIGSPVSQGTAEPDSGA